MKHTDYIVPIGEDAQEYDEMFIGVIRRQPELVRCKDCKWADWYTAGNGGAYCYCLETGTGGNEKDDFCSRAERKEE